MDGTSSKMALGFDSSLQQAWMHRLVLAVFREMRRLSASNTCDRAVGVVVGRPGKG